MFLDAGLRMDGIPALDRWDLVIAVLHTSKNIPASGNRSREETQSANTNPNTKAKIHSNREVDELSKVDHVVPSGKPSHFEAQLCIFEKHEAVIKMIIKGRSPTMRHVSRYHRATLWLVVWQNPSGLENPHQIWWHQTPTRRHVAERKFHPWWVESSSPIILTSWIFRCFLAAMSAPLKIPKPCRRGSCRKDVMVKSKPTMSSVSRSVNRSPTLDSGVSYSQGNYGMQSQNSDLSSIEKSIAKADWRSGIGKPIAQIHNRLTETKLAHNNFQIFNVPYLKKVFTNVRQKFSRHEEDQMLDLEVNGIIWWIFLSETMKAAVRLGPVHEQNLCTTKNTDFEQFKTLCDISQRLILNHGSENGGISTIKWHLTPWRRSTLLHD